jgi:hypothetical protein
LQNRVRPKIFGVGFNKTGTTTLAACLKHFGFRHLGHRRDLLVAFRHGDLARVFQETDRFDSFDDWPYPLMYEDLFKQYGARAKFILTMRQSSEVWLNSLKAHALITNPENHSRKLAYGYDYPHGREAEHIAMYEAHNAAVKNFFTKNNAEHQLLCVSWDQGHGWAELCSFLGLPKPATAFPHFNKASDGDPTLVARNKQLIAGTGR